MLGHVDDIHYIVKLCFCLHNAMVMQCVENNDDPKTEDIYNHTIGTGTTGDDKVKDNVDYEIEWDNIFSSTIP